MEHLPMMAGVFIVQAYFINFFRQYPAISIQLRMLYIIENREYII